MNTEIEEPRNIAAMESPRKTAASASRHVAWDDSEPEVSGFKKWRFPILAGVILAGGIGFVASSLSKKTGTPPPPVETTVVHIVTPPPPQPTPPPPPQPTQVEEKKQEMVEEVKQEEAPPEPSPQVETALKGTGNAGMVLKAGNGSGIFGGGNHVSAERLRWSAYAGQVKSRIAQALESSPKTRKARMTIVANVWLDQTGRITRTTLDGSTSDAAVDSAIRDEVLPGLQLSEPPPQGMPMPIRMRISAQRRN